MVRAKARARPPAGELNFPAKASPLLRTLIGVYTQILEHKRVITESQILAAGSGHIT